MTLKAITHCISKYILFFRANHKNLDYCGIARSPCDSTDFLFDNEAINCGAVHYILAKLLSEEEIF